MELYDLLLYKGVAGDSVGGGVDPESITLETLNVSQNGTTNAPSGKAYNKVVAAVPNTYGASDEGKVVSNGALVSQTAHAEVTQNGTIDTTLNNSVTVNVPDGFPTDTASGAIASFPDGADDVPVKSLVAQIAPVQSGSGDPSPTNMRLISGWTSATITRTGADNQSDTYTIAFPSEAGTVYGGTLDVTNGVLTVNWAMVDMGSLPWLYSSEYKFFYTGNALTDKKVGVLNVKSDMFRTKSGSWSGTPDDNALWANGTNVTIYAQYAAFESTSADEFKAFVSGHQLVYELANPVTYQLDPVTVTTLLGMNSIQANTGDVEVEYYADVDLYVQKKSVTLETLNATANGTYTPTTGHAYSSVVVAIPAVTGVSF